MPVIAIITIIFQILLALHVVKRGHNLYWIFIIIFFPLIGGIVYLIVAVLPEIQNSHGIRRAGSRIKGIIDPNRDIRVHTNNLDMADTVENKINLANELMNKGMIDEAVTLYKESLTGMYEFEPVLMLGLAKAYFKKENYAAAKDTLDVLIKENPDYKSQEGHLLYARSLEMLGENESALDEYKVISEYYSGYEAKCRFAQFLKKQGNVNQANDLFKEIIDKSKFATKHAKKINDEWIKIAKKEIT